MNCWPILALAALLTAFSSGRLAALETDAYLAWLADIPDSTELLDDYINRMVSERLDELAALERSPEECHSATIEGLAQLHRSVFRRRRTRRFLQHDPEVGAWKKGGYWSSVFGSYYRYNPTLYVSSTTKSIEINGVRLSLDKVGHLFGVGRRYYKRYLKQRAAGRSHEEAERSVIHWGLRHENGFLGKWIDGVFSHADLEANYQGLRLAWAFCEGPEPYLRRQGSRWVLQNRIRIADFVNSYIDEGYNNNHFTKLLFVLVRGRLRDYCGIVDLPQVQRRLAHYATFEPSFSRQTIADLYESKGVDPQYRHSLARTCAASRGADARPPATSKPWPYLPQPKPVE